GPDRLRDESPHLAIVAHVGLDLERLAPGGANGVPCRREMTDVAAREAEPRAEPRGALGDPPSETRAAPRNHDHAPRERTVTEHGWGVHGGVLAEARVAAVDVLACDVVTRPRMSSRMKPRGRGRGPDRRTRMRLSTNAPRAMKPLASAFVASAAILILVAAVSVLVVAAADKAPSI